MTSIGSSMLALAFMALATAQCVGILGVLPGRVRAMLLTAGALGLAFLIRAHGA